MSCGFACLYFAAKTLDNRPPACYDVICKESSIRLAAVLALRPFQNGPGQTAAPRAFLFWRTVMEVFFARLPGGWAAAFFVCRPDVFAAFPL